MSRDPRSSFNLAQVTRHLQSIVAAAEDTGYFGPGSAIWMIGREAITSLGLDRALLLQLAHPWVAQAVHDHSDVVAHPLQRLVTTATSAELLVFGSRSQADQVAARIRAVHSRVRGTLAEDAGRWRRGDPYRADDPDALLWVLATLIDTSIVVYEACLGRLPERTVASYLSDAARIGEMLGLPARMVPGDRAALTRYLDTMLTDGTIAVSSAARDLAARIHTLPEVTEGGHYWRAYHALSTGIARATLPKALLQQYDMVPGRRERLRYHIAGRAARRLLPRLPSVLRVDPVTRRAIRQAEILRLIANGQI
jgi:uncharacterized protein (DUF2236 family)